jgi:hypothetical protein
MKERKREKGKKQRKRMEKKGRKGGLSSAFPGGILVGQKFS